MDLTTNNSLTPSELIDATIDWICEYALDRQTVEKLIAEQKPDITEDEISEIIQQAFEKIAASYGDQSPLKVITEHIGIYEELYRYFRKIGNASGVNKAMEGKERLLRIWNDSNKVTLRRTKTTIIETPVVEYDINKLTLEEQDRLKFLQQKASVE